MNRTRYECQSQGCTNEVLSKTVDGTPIDPLERRHRASGPSSPSSGTHHRHSHPPAPQQAAAQASPYCKRHACVQFLSSESCLNKKLSHDSVCAAHAKCHISDCSQPRAQYLDPSFDHSSGATPIYDRLDVCADHKCIVQRCPQRRATSATSFCQAHRCRADGCTNQHLDHIDCCEDHQCGTRGCRNPTNGDYRFCDQHIRCEIQNCGARKHQDRKTKVYLPYCTQHITCSVPRCEKTKADRSAFCKDHTCHERDCAKSANSKPYCDDHGCSEATCTGPRLWSKNFKHRHRYCPLHTCRGENCKEYVDSLALFCQTHGCSKPRCHEGMLAEQMCLEHLKAHYTSLGRRRAAPAQPFPSSSAQSKPRSGRLTPRSSRLEEDDATHQDSAFSEEEVEVSPKQHQQQQHEPIHLSLGTKGHGQPSFSKPNHGNIRDDAVSDDDISELSSSDSDSDSKRSTRVFTKNVGRTSPPFTKISHSQSFPGPIRGAPPPFPPASGPGNPPPHFGPGGGGGGSAGFVTTTPGMNGAGNGGHQLPGGPPPVRRTTGGGA